MNHRTIIVAFMAVASLSGCATARHNYTDAGPRYAGAASAGNVRARDTLVIASFNIQFALHIDSALTVIHGTPELRDADVLLLQEMDEAGTQRIASALGMSYVYYPATLHPKTQRDFGTAILSRYAIVADSKILLPHISRFRKTQRTATAATILAGTDSVRVYSTHLGTIADVSYASRRDQLRAILNDAKPYRHVVIGGDLNSKGVGAVARENGYAWPTENGPHTVHMFRWDHVFLKGFSLPDRAATGTVTNLHHASDHRPIWVRAVLAR